VGKLILALLLTATCAAHAQSPNLGMNKITPGPPKPRAPETIEAVVQNAVPDRLVSIGNKLKETQLGLMRSAELLGRLQAVRADSPMQKADLAANAQALMAQINEQRRTLNFAQDSVVGVARQSLSQSQRAQAESYLKSITVLKGNAQTLAGITSDIVRRNSSSSASR